jgi:endonuclease/exonuclease/phosphatase family metal-dependent hydrolase
MGPRRQERVSEGRVAGVRCRMPWWVGLVVAAFGFADVRGAVSPPATATATATVTNRVVFRVGTANCTGDSQRYDDAGIRLLQALAADVLAVQEFNYRANSAADLRAFVGAVAGTNAVFFRESGPGLQIPNGVVSRFPLRAAGSWADARVANRGFVWARVDVPGERDLFVVSVHLKAGGGSSDASTRQAQAAALRTLVLANAPADAFVALAGDLNLQNRGEAALATLRTFLEDEPWPADQSGNPNTNNARERPYDQVLVDSLLAAVQVPTRLGGEVFPSGVVFDPRRFVPAERALPALAGDAAGVQHLPVARDFAVAEVRVVEVPAPRLSFERGWIRWAGVPGVTYRVEGSRDLRAWDEAGRVTVNDEAGTFEVVREAETVFYRVAFP